MNTFSEIWGMLLPVLLLVGGALAYIVAIDSLRLVRMRRVWLPVVAGAVMIASLGLFLTDAPNTPDWQMVLGLLLMLSGMASVVFGMGFLLVRATRIQSAVAKLQAIEDQGGVNSSDLRIGHRNPALHLHQLLPLIESIGHAPGHPEITVEWIRDRLQTLGENETPRIGAGR